MNLSNTERKSASGAVDSSIANTRLTGSWLIVARVVWLALVVPSLGLFVANLVAYDQQLQRACAGPFLCNLTGALTAKDLQAFSSGSISVSWYAALLTISLALIVSIWCGVGFLIFWRRSDDWLALLAAFFLVMFSITPSGNNPGFVILFAYPVLALPISLVSFLGQISISVFFSLFPNGRLVPRWMGLVLLLYIIYAFFNNFPFPTSTFDMNWPVWLNLLITLGFPGAIVISQIYRFRRVSTPLQRQQTKWILLGATVAVAVVIGLQLISFLILPSQNPLGGGSGVILSYIFFVAFLLIPLSIGFSFLRYRLYDIDVLINRTLVYGALTGILALLYFGMVLGLQFLFDRIMGPSAADSPLILVGSTLVIAALFQPLRHRVQSMIDRRFYRSRYDARRTIANFSASLRGEVDLAELSERLVAVVQETMQPTHVSLWLSQPRKVQSDFSGEISNSRSS
ncbi:MAG TPA: hypothetical protein VGT44_13875 [Ktedonobacteraceae bacterium]|nr:hypothetical protein [Ktedonobacteraceae bacterium]